MRALTASELLDVWERGLRQPAAWRPIALLEPLYAGSTVDELARLPVGQRDARLFDLRRSTFGRQLAAVTDCPACGQRLDLEFDVEDIRPSAPASEDRPPMAITVRQDGWEVTARLPDTSDLAAAAATGHPAAARRTLLRRCLSSVRTAEGEEAAWEKLPESVLEAVGRRITEADPQADVQLALSCPQCGHAWNAPFDIGAFVWAELQGSARRLLGDVHELAWAYGWSEADILNMSPERRSAYLELIRP